MEKDKFLDASVLWVYRSPGEFLRVDSIFILLGFV
jgi:hypothetical protein